MSEDATIIIPLKIEADKKSTEQTADTFASITSLVADLAIIGTVAGKALSKIWGAVSGSVQVGADAFSSSVDALINDFSVVDYNKLRTAMQAAGGSADDAQGITDQVNNLIKSIQNPKYNEGKYREQLETAMAKAGASEGLADAIRAALGQGKGLDATQLIGQMISGAGVDGKEVATMLGLDSMAILENDQSYSYFKSVMGEANMLYDRNLELLGSLNDSIALLTAATDSMKTDFASLFAPGGIYFSQFSAGLGEAFSQLTDKYLGSDFFENRLARKEKEGNVSRWELGGQTNEYVTGEDLKLREILAYFDQNLDDYGGKTNAIRGFSEEPRIFQEMIDMLGVGGQGVTNISELMMLTNMREGAMGEKGSLVPYSENMIVNIYDSTASPKEILDEIEQKINDRIIEEEGTMTRAR